MIRLSHHAQARMAERNIGPATLNAVLASGEVMGVRLHNVHLELLGYRAVVGPRTMTVVTVYETNVQRRTR